MLLQTALFHSAEQYPIAYKYLIFFIYSSVNGRSGCLHVLAIVNSAAMNIGVHVSCYIIVFSNFENNLSRIFWPLLLSLK